MAGNGVPDFEIIKSILCYFCYIKVMVRVYKTKRGCLRGEAIRRSKIFDYSDDCKLLVFKVLARMRT